MNYQVRITRALPESLSARRPQPIAGEQTEENRQILRFPDWRVTLVKYARGGERKEYLLSVLLRRHFEPSSRSSAIASIIGLHKTNPTFQLIPLPLFLDGEHDL